ncbi:MAG: hypothetical protein ACLRRT_09365 [Ruthenibacterium lactatiformans]
MQTLPEDRALNSFAAGETAETENTAAPQMEAETPHQTALRLWKKNSGAIRFVLWARCLTRHCHPTGKRHVPFG